MRGGLEGGQVPAGAGFRVKPYLAVARLTLGLVLCACAAGALAQSAPAQTPPQAPAQTPVQNPPTAAAPDAPPAAATDNAAAGTGAPQHDASGSTADVNLSGVNVQGKRNVFTDNDKKLKDLQEALPCAGCDAKPHVKKKFVKRVLDSVAERVTPTEAPDHSNRDPNDKAQDFSQQGNCNAGNVGGCVPDNLKP